MAWIGAGVTQWFGGQGTEPQITAFFRQKLAREEALAVVQRWREDEAVARAVFIPREEALARLRQTDLARRSRPCPTIPYRTPMTLVPRRHAPQDVAELQQRLTAEPGIEAVQVDTAWVERVHGLARAGTMVAAALAAWFALGMLAQTYLAIRLQLVAAAQEISVLRALGATDGYIGRRFAGSAGCRDCSPAASARRSGAGSSPGSRRRSTNSPDSTDSEDSSVSRLGGRGGTRCRRGGIGGRSEPRSRCGSSSGHRPSGRAGAHILETRRIP